MTVDFPGTPIPLEQSFLTPGKLLLSSAGHTHYTIIMCRGCSGDGRAEETSSSASPKNETLLTKSKIASPSPLQPPDQGCMFYNPRLYNPRKKCRFYNSGNKHSWVQKVLLGERNLGKIFIILVLGKCKSSLFLGIRNIDTRRMLPLGLQFKSEDIQDLCFVLFYLLYINSSPFLLQRCK